MNDHRYLDIQSISCQDPYPTDHEISTDLQCEGCGFTFASKADLAAHLSSSFALDKFTFEYLLSRLNLTIDQIAVNQKISLCKSSPLVADQEEVHACPECKKIFKSNRGMSQHLGKVHKKQASTVACAKCDRLFKTKHALKSHYQQVHEKVNRVRCKECGKYLYLSLIHI